MNPNWRELFARLVAAAVAMGALRGAFAGEAAGPLRIGWASADITPAKPVVLTGFSSARVSEGVTDSSTATALVLDAVREGRSGAAVVLVSCDLIAISEKLRDSVREKAGRLLPELDAGKIILNATHTHCAPETRTSPELVSRLHHELITPCMASRYTYR